METKLFEIRDEGTCIAAIGTLMDLPENEGERWLLRREGYQMGSGLVLLGPLDGNPGGYQTTYTHESHGGGPRTWPVAHRYIQEHWHELQSGHVICVEWILGERDTPKRSDRFPNDAVCEQTKDRT